MATRRMPLGNLPNGGNSPFREPVAPGTKRPRGHAQDQLQPPAKKQIIETEDAENRRQAVGKKTTSAFTSKTTAGAGAAKTTSSHAMSTLRRTDAARARAPAGEKPKATQENLHDVREWQRHYKKLFPKMVFYYDNVPDEVRHRISKQVQMLGSTEEVFFSKKVTHVVTTRTVPTDITDSSSSVAGRSPPKNGTVNPSHLKRGGASALHPNDILLRTKDMGMKVWKLEKLERMLVTMFNAETGEAPIAPHRAAGTQAKQSTHLSQMLQKEKEYGQSNMEWAMDMVPFRGYYIYVHDMDEVQKPTIMRDYNKPVIKEQGKWPQLRVTAPGRCPFLDDPSAKYERPAPPPPAEKAPRTRAAAAREKTPIVPDRAMTENNNLAQRRQRAASAQAEETNKMDPPKGIPSKRGSTDNLPLFGSAQASLRQHPRFAGGEPVASGVQPSNITSAIRSQMISSTAAQPGGKAGASKELNHLKRQVLERNNLTNPYLNNDLRGAINGGGRGQKRKAQEALAGIKEEDDGAESAPKRAAPPAPARKKKVEKEMKPGYCENCRAKFQDFDEHVVSRTHRKFATTDENWTELDNLLELLIRPEKLFDE